jgi:transcriptional regulator with XRE-family HTH domain
VADLCRRLQDAREASGLSIEEISARTKIKGSTLRALEAGAFDTLPGDFYTRAFLKNYSRELHLPADEMVAEFDALRRPPPAVSVEETPTPPAAPPEKRKGPRTIVIRVPEDAHIWAVGALAIILVTIIAVATRPAPRAKSEERPPVAALTPAAADPAPIGTAGKEPPPDKLTIDIRPTAPIWVAATADGASAIYRLLKPGEQVVVEARKELSFRIGNAGAFVYTINGAPGKSLGGPDEVREFDITTDNYQTFRR